MISTTPITAPYISFWNTQCDSPEVLTSEATLLERLRHVILDGHREDALPLLEQALKQVKADIVAQECLLPTARELTDKFNNMEMLLPFVLQSAAILRQCWQTVLPQCQRFASPASCIMMTVAGDTHEVGKNIVDTLLQAHGFTVRNLGALVTAEALLVAVETFKPDAVIMSGLLIESGKKMKHNIQALRQAGVTAPVILGGPALTPQFVLKECRPVSPKHPVLHARSAMDTLAYLQGIAEAKAQHKLWHPPVNAEPQPPTPSEMMQQADDDAAPSAVGDVARKRSVAPTTHLPSPPFWGVRQVEDIPLSEIYPFLNDKVLMTGHWGFRRWDKTPEEQEGFIQQYVQPLYEELKHLVASGAIFTPKVRYGYFPVLAEGDTIILFKPEDHSQELARFTFPRGGKKQLCLSDYIVETPSSMPDVLALQLVTMGDGAAAFDQSLFAQGDYMRYYLYHGFSVEMAEALAEYWHATIRRELGITEKESGKTGLQLLKPSAYQGCRYSFGYPACPALQDQTLLMELLEGEKIGVQLTENYMLTPEQSTSAIVFHHPEAYYFDVTE
jgi:5-methyltetrahydrofolate--homocysteine methyltransferase